MRLSWNEIRTRAAKFAKEWEGEGYEKGRHSSFIETFSKCSASLFVGSQVSKNR